MKLICDMMFAEIEQEIVGLPVGVSTADFKGLIKVNEPARDIIELLKEDISLDELTAKMLEMYDVEEEKLRIDIHDTLSTLEKNGLLEK